MSLTSQGELHSDVATETGAGCRPPLRAAITEPFREGTAMPGHQVVRDEGSVAVSSPSRPLRRAEAAAYVSERFFPCSPKTLAKLVVVGGGPQFRKAGKWPIYEKPDLDHWAQSKLSPKVSSSSAGPQMRGPGPVR